MMGFPGGNAPDLTNAEIVDFTIESGDARVRLKLKDGVILEIKMEVTHIMRVGSDPQNGLPTYMIQTANLTRIVYCPKELRKAPLKPGSSSSPKALQGFG